MLDRILPRVLAYNSPLAYVVAGGILVLGLLAATLGRRLALHLIGPGDHEGDPPPLRALAAIVHATWRPLPLVIATLLASRLLDLPHRVADGLDHGAALFLVAQAGVWGHSLVDHVLTAWFDRHAQVDAATRSGRGMLRFAGTTLIWGLAVITGLKCLGINISALVAGLGVFGVAVTLATQSLVGDLFASLSILLDKPFLVGDTIATGAITGRVERIGARTTRLRNVGGEEVVVPNSDLIRSRLHNFRTLTERRIAFRLRVRYETPPERLRAARQVVREAIEAQEGVRFDRAELLAFGEVGLDFEVVYFVQGPDYGLYTALQERINLAIIEGFWGLGVGFAHTGRGAPPSPTAHAAGPGWATGRPDDHAESSSSAA